MIAYIGLGSNLGDSPGFIREALHRLTRLGTVTANSDLYLSLPWGKADQPEFYNAVAAIDTALDAKTLVSELQAIETALGRKRDERWGPRTIDLDLLLYDAATSADPDCVLPHPRLRERAFALVPLSEIAPELRIPPDGATAAQVLAHLPEKERRGVRRLANTARPRRPRVLSYDEPAGPGSKFDLLRPLSAFDLALFDIVAGAIGMRPGMRALDVGCGTGRFTQIFAERGATVTGVDRSSTMLAAARRRPAKQPDNPRYLEADACKELPAGSYDAIVAFFAIHYLESIPQFLTLARNRLKKDGMLAIATFPHRHFVETPFAQFFPSILEIDLARFPAAPTLMRLVKEAGFSGVTRHDLHVDESVNPRELIARVEEKYLSSFHLLSDHEFRRGLESMRAAWRDQEKISRPISAVVVLGEKPRPSPAQRRKNKFMERPKASDNSIAASLSKFIEEQVAPLAKIFAESPLMELRLRTSDGSVTLVKSDSGTRVEVSPPAAPKTRPYHARAAHLPLLPEDEPGRPYDTINADVVGVFRSASDPASPGDAIVEDRILGYIEALKLKYPVRSGGPGAFVAQVVEDGQAVDFGEPLFVIDRSEQVQTNEGVSEEALEPPRL